MIVGIAVLVTVISIEARTMTSISAAVTKRRSVRGVGIWRETWATVSGEAKSGEPTIGAAAPRRSAGVSRSGADEGVDSKGGLSGATCAGVARDDQGRRTRSAANDSERRRVDRAQSVRG